MRSILLVIILLSLNSFAKDNEVKNLENRVIQESQNSVYKLKNMFKKHHKHKKKRRKKHKKKFIVKPFNPQ